MRVCAFVCSCAVVHVDEPHADEHGLVATIVSDSASAQVRIRASAHRCPTQRTPFVERATCNRRCCAAATRAPHAACTRTCTAPTAYAHPRSARSAAIDRRRSGRSALLRASHSAPPHPHRIGRQHALRSREVPHERGQVRVGALEAAVARVCAMRRTHGLRLVLARGYVWAAVLECRAVLDAVRGSVRAQCYNHWETLSERE